MGALGRPDVVTMSTISLAVTVVGGWIWATTYFMVRNDADIVHDGLVRDIRAQYLELKIDSAQTELVFIEADGVQAGELRNYELLKFSVQRMTEQLMDLDK
jgi:hypothetical protein